MNMLRYIILLLKLDKKTRTKKIWIYKDRSTGVSKGECTITYDDPQVCQIRYNTFVNKYPVVA